MKKFLPLAGGFLALGLLLFPSPAKADPSIAEKAVYDKARYSIVSKLTDDEFISYCITANIGGDSLFKSHDQILSKQFELTKLLAEGYSNDNPQVLAATSELKDLRSQFSVKLNEVRKGLEIESKIADETLSALNQK